MLSEFDLLTYQRTCLAHGLRPNEVEDLLSIATEVLYRGGDQIIKHKSGDADLYLILDGKVNLLTDDGDKVLEVGPGYVVGEISFLDAGPRDISANAIAHVTALRFPADELRRRMCANKEFGFRILANLSRVLCARMREAEDKLDSLMDNAHEAWVTWDK